MDFRSVLAVLVLVAAIDANPKLTVNQVIQSIFHKDKCASFNPQTPLKTGQEWEGTWYLQAHGPLLPNTPDFHCIRMNALTSNNKSIVSTGSGFIDLKDWTVPVELNNVITDRHIYFETQLLKKLDGSYWYFLGGEPDEYSITYMCMNTKDMHYGLVHLYTRSFIRDEDLMDTMYKIVQQKVGYTKDELWDVPCKN